MKHQLEILYEDSHIIVCFKPHGLATQSRRAGLPDMERMILNHLALNNPKDKPYLAVIHRLDQPVSGILVFAKTPKAAKELNRQLTEKGFGKHYLAQVDGIPPKSEGSLTDYMVKDGRTNTSRICEKNTPGAKQARLSYQTVSEHPSLYTSIFPETVAETEESAALRTLLKITLDTGRHHQIRVQLAHIGCPIVGDTKYNPKAASACKWQSIRLCAYRLTFRHPVTDRTMNFSLAGEKTD